MDKSLAKQIVRISIPAIIVNITTPLLALSDTAITGHMGSAVFLAAIAVGGTMFNMLYWLFGFLRMSTSGLAAQAYGRGIPKQSHAVLSRALFLSLAIGVVVLVFSQPEASALLKIMDASGETALLARQYFMICIWGAPASLGMMALTGWSVGMQDSKLPMWTSMLSVVVNIALSITLTLGLGLKIEGVAIGTLIAQWTGFLVCFLIIVRRHGWIWLNMKELTTGAKKYFRINADIFLRTLCLVAVTMWFTRTGAMQGAVMLAVNALLMQFFTLFSFFMDGLAFAAEAICGRYAGASDKAMLRRSVSYFMKSGAAIGIIFTTAYFVVGDTLLGWLSDEQEVIGTAGEYFCWAVSIPAVSVMAFVWDGVFIGLTRTRYMLASMALSAVVFFGLCTWLIPDYGNHGLWIAFLSYLLSRGIVLTVSARKVLR